MNDEYRSAGPQISIFHLKEFIYGNCQNKLEQKDLRMPQYIGDFSLDSERKIIFSNENIKTIKRNYISISNEEKIEKVCFDLNEGMDKVKRKDYNATKNEKLDRLLKWILNNQFKFETEDSKKTSMQQLSTDFICFRGLLTEILCTIYEKREGWIIHATKFRNTIYLLAKETPEKESRRMNETDNDRRMSSWGFKFEQFMTEDNTSEAVNENEEYCCVMRTRLSSHSLVYGAEVDGIDEDIYHYPHSDLKAFVELKTCKELDSQRGINNFYRFRLRKWYLQSHLVGIPRVICGFRDADGTVHQLKSYNVEEMPEMSKIHWNKNLMFDFLDKFLSWLKTVIIKDDPDFVYEIVRPPNSLKIDCFPLGHRPELCVLTKEFTDNIFK